MAENLGTVRVPFQEISETLSKLTVPELQQELKRRGLKRSGVKAKLIQRLKEAIELQEEQNEEIAAEEIEDETPVDYHEKEENKTDSLQDPHNESYGMSNEESYPTHDSAEIQPDQLQSSIQDSLPEDSKPTYSEVQELDMAKESVAKEYDNSSMKIDTSCSNLDQPDESSNVENKPMDTSEGEPHPNKGETSANEDTIIDSDVVSSIDPTMTAKPDMDKEIKKETHKEEEFSNTTANQQDTDNISECKKNDASKKTCNASDDVQEESSNKHEVVIMQVEDRKPTEAIKEDHSLEDVDALDYSIDEEKPEGDEALEIEASHSDQADFEDGDEPVEKETKKSEKKYTTPVQIKKRKLTIDGSSTAKSDSSSARKRRWGSSSNRDTLTISSDSLKAIIPDVVPPSVDDPIVFGLDYGDMEEGEIDDSYAGNQAEEEESEMKGEEDSEGVKEQKTFKKEIRRGRIVRISTKDTVKMKTLESAEKAEETSETEPNVTEVANEEKVSLLPEIITEEPANVVEKSPSPARNSPAQILSIFNLVRPFTLRQLRELLSKTGTLVEDGFWINQIKSHCYVTYETIEEAETSRNALHGMKWPSGNPKLLSVDFAINDVMYRQTEGKLGTAPLPPPSPEHAEEEAKLEVDHVKARASERPREKLERGKQRREHARYLEREKENKEEETVKNKIKKEAPAKLLDDLFRKTKATPCIYWLPLTKEQIAAKEKDRDMRREARRKQREKEIASENAERESRRKQREMEIQRQRERSRERRSPPHHIRGRQTSKSPKIITRSPELPRRGIRSLPAQYRRRSPSSSSSS